MQLLYRGISYEFNHQFAQNQSAPADTSTPHSTPKPQLVYRGNPYQTESIARSTANHVPASTTTLMYRGHRYEHRLPTFSLDQSLTDLKSDWQLNPQA